MGKEVRESLREEMERMIEEYERRRMVEKEAEWNERRVILGEEMRTVLEGTVLMGRKEKGGKSKGDEEGVGEGIEEERR